MTARIVGDGPPRGEAEHDVRRLGLSEHVCFLGAVGQDHLRDHYARADIFCGRGGRSWRRMEAMAMELSVVSTRIAGIPELVDDGERALLVAPGSVDDPMDALDRLVRRHRSVGGWDEPVARRSVPATTTRARPSG